MHVAKAFGIFVSDKEEDVEIVFDAEIAWRVEERTHHPSEQKERLPDGRLRYRLRTRAQWEVLPWVQSFGPLAELVAPASWRDVPQEPRSGCRTLRPDLANTVDDAGSLDRGAPSGMVGLALRD